MSSQSALLTLAEDIRNRTFTIVQHLQDAKQAEPNFEPDSPVVEARVQSEEIQHLRNSINDAANDLLLLLNGPRSFLRTFLTTHYELAAYQTAVEYKFFENVPLKGGVHVTELANVVGMDADRVGRFLRLLATQRVFKEIEKNVFGHTAASATLAIDGELNSAVGMQLVFFIRISKAQRGPGLIAFSGWMKCSRLPQRLLTRFGTTLQALIAATPHSNVDMGLSYSNFMQSIHRRELVSQRPWQVHHNVRSPPPCSPFEMILRLF